MNNTTIKVERRKTLSVKQLKRKKRHDKLMRKKLKYLVKLCHSKRRDGAVTDKGIYQIEYAVQYNTAQTLEKKMKRLRFFLRMIEQLGAHFKKPNYQRFFNYLSDNIYEVMQKFAVRKYFILRYYALKKFRKKERELEKLLPNYYYNVHSKRSLDYNIKAE